MADATGAPGAARPVHPPCVYTAQERQAWLCTVAGQRWEHAITRATDDEGVDAAVVMAAFFARFATGDQGVNVRVWGEGQELPAPVRGWLREEGYVQSYGDSSSGSGSGSDEEEAPDEGGRGPSPARTGAPRPGQQQAAPRGAAPAGSAAPPGSRQGRGSSQAGTSHVPPQSEEASLRRSTREQAQMPSELPEPLAAYGRASGVSPPGPGASARPPNPSAEGGGRRP